MGRWHRDDIHCSHLMRIQAHVIVVSVRHLLLRGGGGSGLGGVRARREIFSFTIDSDMVVSVSAEHVS